MTVRKRDIVVKVSAKTGYNIRNVVQIMDSIIEELIERLQNQERIELRGFGAFDTKIYKAKIGRNPKDAKKDIVIPERPRIRFKPGKILKGSFKE